jgi:SNF2 family DNA or RNA helicase
MVELELRGEPVPQQLLEQDIPPEPVMPAIAKPKLCIVIPDLIEQWAEHIATFSPHMRVIIYYGDQRSKKVNRWPQVNGLLSKKHTIFSDQKADQIVVLTSLPTINARHGPSAQARWRIEKGFSRAKAIDQQYALDDTWPGNLSGLFDILVIDEAHCIKNSDTSSHCTVRWLSAVFIILATASVIPNRIDDFRGYIRLIEVDSNQWDLVNLQRLGISRDTNVFELPDDHDAVFLRMTTYAVER